MLFVIFSVWPYLGTLDSALAYDGSFESKLNWTLIFLIYGLVIIYICLIPFVLVYLFVRKSRVEHPLLPITAAFVLNVLVLRFFARDPAFNQFIPAIISVFAGLCFWRLYSGRWWGRIQDNL
jgi:hypothetical protein